MPDDRPIPRGPDPLWEMIIKKEFLPAWDANQKRLMLDLHRRVVELERAALRAMAGGVGAPSSDPR